jgi:prolipoprotein diacylglyceryl transferase
MYPDLSYILHALIGTSPDNGLSVIKTFGLFLILAFLGSAATIRFELKRKEREGILKPVKEQVTIGREATLFEIGSNVLLGFVLGFKLPYIMTHFADFKEDAAGVLLSMQGTLIWGIAGAALLGYLKYREGQKNKLPKPEQKTITVWPHQRVGDITVVAAVSGILGAKLAAPFESAENFRAFLKAPVEQLLSGSGLAIYGGLILAAFAVIWYVKKKGIPALHVMDAAAPALFVGYGIGRIGCQLSGDGDWGIVNTAPPPSWWIFPDSFWAFDYPHNVLHEGVRIEDCIWQYCHVLESTVFPTPIYESVVALLCAGLLLFLGRKIKITGLLFFIYVILTGVERFLIEKIRVNPDIDIAGVRATQAEYISVLLVLIGISGIAWCLKRKPAAPD